MVPGVLAAFAPRSGEESTEGDIFILVEASDEDAPLLLPCFMLLIVFITTSPIITML